MAGTDADAAFLARLTVLFVEDSPALRTMVSKLLGPKVGRLCLAENGLDGMEVFHRETPNLVVTDIEMPRMDGLAMAEAMRREKPDLPVVVLTSSDSSRYMLRSIDIGVDRYVLKPIVPDQLQAAVLHCARQLRAEHDLRLHHRLEQELARARQHESLAILAKGIAHDYNNLLQAILTGVETARSVIPPDNPVGSLLAKTEAYTEMAQALGKQLLALGQINDQLNEEGPLKPLVKAAVRRVLEGAPIEVSLSFEPTLPEVRYNQARLGQALDTLLLNAREAMPQGGSLEIRATVVNVDVATPDNSLPPGPFIRLSLKDSGPGIPADLLPRIFDPYQSSKTKPSIKGKGLGLAICRSILLAHHGQVTAESRVGLGSTFHLFLPAASIP